MKGESPALEGTKRQHAREDRVNQLENHRSKISRLRWSRLASKDQGQERWLSGLSQNSRPSPRATFLHSCRAPGGFYRVQPGQRGSAGHHHLGLDRLTPLTDMYPRMRLQPPLRPPASRSGHGPRRWCAWKPFWRQKIVAHNRSGSAQCTPQQSQWGSLRVMD